MANIKYLHKGNNVELFNEIKDSIELELLKSQEKLDESRLIAGITIDTTTKLGSISVDGDDQAKTLVCKILNLI